MGWVTLTLRKRVLKQSHAGYQMRDLQISREKRQLARRKQYETAVIQNEQSQAITPLKLTYNETIDKLEENRKALTSYLRIAKQYTNSDKNDNISILNSGKLAVVNNENGEYISNSEGLCTVSNEDGTIRFVRYNELNQSKNGEYNYAGKYIQDNGYEVWDKIENFQRIDIYFFNDIMEKYNLPDISTIGDDLSSLESTINSELSNIQMEKENAQLEYTEETNNYKTFYEDELAMLEEDVNDEETMLDLEQSDVESQMEAISQELQSVGEAVSSQIQSSTIKLA